MLITMVKSVWSYLQSYLDRADHDLPNCVHCTVSCHRASSKTVGDRTNWTSPSCSTYGTGLETIVKICILRSRKTWIFTRATRKSWFPLVFCFLSFLPKRIKFRDCRLWYQLFKCLLVTCESCQSEFRTEILLSFCRWRVPSVISFTMQSYDLLEQ